jgi:hypothetical protein
MRLIGLAVVHTVGLVLSPLAAEAQQTGKVYRIGLIGSGTPPPPAGQGSLLYPRPGCRVDPNWRGHLCRRRRRRRGPRATGDTHDSDRHVAGWRRREGGLAASLARPGGNMTGPHSPTRPGRQALVAAEGGHPGKWVTLLREAVPKVSGVAVLAVSQTPAHHTYWKEIQGVARALKMTPQRLEVAGPTRSRTPSLALVSAVSKGSSCCRMRSPVLVERRSHASRQSTDWRGCTRIDSM